MPAPIFRVPQTTAEEGVVTPSVPPPLPLSSLLVRRLFIIRLAYILGRISPVSRESPRTRDASRVFFVPQLLLLLPAPSFRTLQAS